MLQLPKTLSIRILERENNRRGDLFGRLVNDLFLALGYDDVRLNIQKSGREVDVEAIHRTEERRVIAECKAIETKTGGDAVNKFVGVLDAERRKNRETVGYFVSLSGFKETAIEQEKEAGGKRVILLNGTQVVEELIKGRIIVTPEKAMERSGRCAADQSDDLVPEDACELLAHEIGWIWVIYFTQNKQRTHFALIHADGEALAPALAQKVEEADKSVGGDLHSLNYLSPVGETISDNLVFGAKEKYFVYLSKECGEITFGGLPADQEVGSRRLDLEHIFIPLYLHPLTKHEQIRSSHNSERREEKVSSEERKSVGEVFSKCPRLAILADPGGGKTTLLKRLAVAYAFPGRRESVDDKLPDKEWLPLFIRCRQLSNLARSSILDIISLIPKWAEMNELADPFSFLVSRALREGKVLLLIDGLDEISEGSERVSFIKQLRIFLSIYPSAGIIVTSREAGFRVVGGALSAHCEHYRIAEFDNDDIRRLTLAWHKEVVGDQEEVRLEAEKLAKTICETERVRALARNPLLLTTLLLVKRWIGQLPSRRSVLYGKAVEVLLMTWNVEGFKPIDQDEAIPQLAFIAFAMMKEGVQSISSRRLKELLKLAREQMPDVLAYARIGVSEFVEQVELRSSILIFSGYSVEQGTLYPMYEFRHLTFQEYLTARAIVDGYYPDRKDGDTILSVLEPYIRNLNWKEVVPLAAILAGRKAQPLIQHLTELCKRQETEISSGGRPRHSPGKVSPVSLLIQCFLDEVQIAPDLLEKGLEWIARRSVGPSPFIPDLYGGKYGNVLLKAVQNAYRVSTTDLMNLGSSLGTITLKQIEWGDKLTPEKTEKITNLLESNDLVQKAAGALATMEIAFAYVTHSRRTRIVKHNKYPAITSHEEEMFRRLGNALVPLLHAEQWQLQFAASWAFAWLGTSGLWNPKNSPDVLSRLLAISIKPTKLDLQYVAIWAISDLPIIDRKSNPFPKPNKELAETIERWWSERKTNTLVRMRTERRPTTRMKKRASIIIGFYSKEPWTDKELAKHVKSINPRIDSWSNGKRILEELESTHERDNVTES